MRDFIPGQSAIYPDQAAALNDLIRRFGTDKGQVQPGTEGPQEYITAKITGTTTGGYAWTEQIPDPTDGTLSDKPGGMSNTTLGPAVELNGSVPASYPYYCELYFRAMSQDGPVYVFELTGDGISATIPDAAYNVAGKINTSTQYLGLGRKDVQYLGLTDTINTGEISFGANSNVNEYAKMRADLTDPTATYTLMPLYGTLKPAANADNSLNGYYLPISVPVVGGTIYNQAPSASFFNGANFYRTISFLPGVINSGYLLDSTTTYRVDTDNGVTMRWAYINPFGNSYTIGWLGTPPAAGFTFRAPLGSNPGDIAASVELGIAGSIYAASPFKTWDGSAVVSGGSGTVGGVTFRNGLYITGTPGGPSIGGAITGASVPGGVLFQDSSGDLAQSSGITFNDTGDQLTLGVANSGTGIARFNQTDAPDTDSMPVGMTFGLFGASF